MKTILIAGYTGMIGNSLMKHYEEHNVLPAGRNDFKMNDQDFARKYEKAELIMNFAGMPVISRWTRKNQKQILESRTGTTRKLGAIIKYGKTVDRQVINASAIGIYPDHGLHDETSKERGNGFIAEVVKAWEKEAQTLEGQRTRVAILRLGIVLGSDGGMMTRLMPFFKAGLGGRIGNGRQAFSWIHVEDLHGALTHIVERREQGVYNLVSPEPCTNRDFTKHLGKALKKPAVLTVPGFALSLVYGKAATTLRGGQAVLPGRLIREGYSFKYPELAGALEDIVN
jgi:uncharacterized protein (TIGR01777 family)